MKEKLPKIIAPIKRFNKFAARKGVDFKRAISRIGFVSLFSYRKNKTSRKRLKLVKSAATRK